MALICFTQPSFADDDDDDDGGGGFTVELAVVVDSLDQVIGPAFDLGKFGAGVVFRMDDGRSTVLQVNNTQDVDHPAAITGNLGDPFGESAPMKFENINCDPPGFIIDNDATSPATPRAIMFVRSEIGPPHRFLPVSRSSH